MDVDVGVFKTKYMHFEVSRPYMQEAILDITEWQLFFPQWPPQALHKNTEFILKPLCKAIPPLLL